MNTDGTKEKNLTNSESNEFNPVFSPVDEKIAYVSDRSGNDDIYFLVHPIDIDFRFKDTDP